MNDNAKRWVEALRSGEFEQGEGNLRVGDRYCCLGVACELAAREGVVRREAPGGPEHLFRYDRRQDFLPPVVQDWLGLRSISGNFFEEDGDGSYTLSRLNDKRRYTFEEIADVIESEPEGLFA